MSKGGCAAFRISRRAPIAVLLALAVVVAGAAGAAAAPAPMQLRPRQKSALEAQAAVVDEVRGRKAEIDALGDRIALDLAEVKRVQQGYAEDRHQVENLVAQLQATLKGIDRKLAGYL